MDCQCNKFATAINCIDGRVQQPVLKWLMERTYVDYVDMITEPGPDKALSEGALEVMESIRQKIMISLEKHQSNFIAIAGHYDCGANGVTKEEHCIQIEKSVNMIHDWFGNATVVGLWVNENWEVEEICGYTCDCIAS